MVNSNMGLTRQTLHTLATQAYGLAMGLQNAAPIQNTGLPKSVQYLLEISLILEKISKSIEEMELAAASERKN